MALESLSRSDVTANDRVVEAFVAVWNTPEEAERARLLEASWADDGEFILPSGVFAGRSALTDYVTRAIGRWPAGSHVEIGSVEEHHGWLYYPWTIYGPDRSTFAQGRHVAERSSDGRLRRMITFPIPTLVQ